jgi:phosphoglycolate phosphatase/putative hydrolase of the HAD superfamily
VKVYYLPPEQRALLFDMDLTLYSSPEYGSFQIDSLVERLAERRGIPRGDMGRLLEERRRSLTDAQGGKKPSLSQIFLSYGITMEENVRWREELYEPSRFLKADKRLGKTLGDLAGSYLLGVVTNNPVKVAQKTLAVLGVGDYFSALAGLDTCMTAKPHGAPFLKIAESLGCPLETCVSIGDRYDIDLAVPLEMGMGGILVDGVEDVYKLPELLRGTL